MSENISISAFFILYSVITLIFIQRCALYYMVMVLRKVIWEQERRSHCQCDQWMCGCVMCHPINSISRSLYRPIYVAGWWLVTSSYYFIPNFFFHRPHQQHPIQIAVLCVFSSSFISSFYSLKSLFLKYSLFIWLNVNKRNSSIQMIL